MQHILLVGGLGESLYLQKKLAELFGIYGTTIVTVEEQTYVPLSLQSTFRTYIYVCRRKKAAA